MELLNINEDFVQFVWKFSLFSKQDLQLPTGEQLQIIYPGTQNTAGGPDFFNAKIYIGETLWVGNVEIHLNTKDWHHHKHAEDAAYNNIILHVIYGENPIPVKVQNGRVVPSISIGKRIYEDTLRRYHSLADQASYFIPCQHFIQKVDDFTFVQFYEALLMERLERKLRDIERDLDFVQGDMDAAFNLNLFKYFGAPLNKGNFELLARSFSLSQLNKQSVSIVQLESLLFGLADLLQHQDAYAQRLLNEFVYTKQLYKLKVFCKERQWNFAGVRPQNFPSLRIAQLAALLYKQARMFSKVLEVHELPDLHKLFAIQVSPYWQEHYSFGKHSKSSSKALSQGFIDKLVINLIAPMLFFYGKYMGEEHYVERAISFIQHTKFERNQITKGFEKLGVPCEDALASQALIALKTNYCNQKKCLQCRIGYKLLK